MMRRPHQLVGRSPEPSPVGCAVGYDISSLATDVASLRRATRSEAPERLGMGEPHPARRFVLLTRCRPSEERFRTWERLCGVPRIEDIVHHEARQEGAVEIPLHLSGPVAEDMDPLGERLPHVGAGGVVELG
jgi:hypothetical protein